MLYVLNIKLYGMIPPKTTIAKKKSKCTKMGNVENYKLHAQELKNTKKLQPFTTSTEFKKFFKHSKLT